MSQPNTVQDVSSTVTYATAMRAAETKYLILVLEEHDLNKAAAARAAGLRYETFCRKIRALKIKFRVVVEE